METLTNIPEDASTKPCVIKIESEEKNISQKNGYYVCSKHPLIDESRQANSEETDEVSEPIYQESSYAGADSEKQAEHQPEGYNIDNKLLRNTEEEGLVTMEIPPKSSSPEDEGPSPLPILAFTKVDVIEEVKKKPHQTLTEEKPKSIDNNCIEHEQTTKVLEGIAQPESMDKACTEKEHTDHQSETQSMEKEILKHIDSKEMMATARGTKMNYETKELEKIPKSHSDEDLTIKDGGNIIMPEEAENMEDSTDVELQKPETESVPDDKATSTLPSIASIQVEIAEKSLHEEIHKEAESPVKDTNERKRPYNDFEENVKVLEALDVHEATVNTSMENENEAQPQYQAQIQETLVIKHLNFEGLNTAQTIPSNNTNKLENVPVSHTGEKLEIEDGRKIKHEKANEMGEETDAQLPKITKESETGDEATSMLPNLVVIEQVEMPKKSFGKKTVEEEESPAIDNNQSLRLQNELEQMSKPPKVIDQPQIMDKDAAETEHTGSQSEAPSMDNAITTHSNSEESLNMKSNAKPNCDVKEQERTPESDLIIRLEIKCDGKIMPEKEIDIKEADEEELQKSETQSVPADKVLSTLHPTGPVSVETVEQSIKKEIHQEVESAATDTEEGQSPEKDLEEIKKVLEVFDLYEATGNTNQENREKTEIQTEVQNLDNLVIKHLNLEGGTIELNMSNGAGDREKVPMSHTEEETEIKESRKCIQEEARDMEEATEDEVFPTMTTLENVKGEAVDEIFQEQNLKKEESAAMDINQPEYELEQTTNVVEAIDQPETTTNISTQNEQHTEHQCKASATEILIAEHIDEEGMVIEESSTKSNYDVDEVEKISMSHSVYNSEILDGSKILTDEATNIKQATNVEIHQSKIESVPEDIVWSKLHSTEAIERVEDNIQEKEIREDEAQSKLLISEIVEVKGEEVQKILQKETLQEEESAAIAIVNSCRPENELEKMVNIDEANNQSETIAKVDAENEEQVNHLSVVSSVESIIIKHIDIEGKVTSKSTSRSSYDIDKLEKTSESHSVANSKIKDDSKITQEDATDIKELTNVGLQESEVESVPEDKDLSNLPNTVATRVEAVTESVEEDLRMDAESEAINTEEGQMDENNFDVPKELDLHDMMDHANAENEKKAKPQPEVTNVETTITTHPTLEGETGETTPTKDTEEKDNILVSHVGEKLHIEVDGKCSQEEANKLEQATDMKILKTAVKSVTEDEAQSELPMLAIVKAKTEETLQQQTHQKEPVVIYNDKSSRPTNEPEKMTNAIEALDQPKTIAKDCAKHGEHTDHRSQASSIDIVLPEQINEEGKKTSESSTKSSADVDQQNITGKHTVKNPETNDGSEITPEEATDIKRSGETESTIYETETETIIQQEIHTDAELEVKDRKEGQLPENDFEERKEVSEPFCPQEVAQHTSSENELKAEPQYEAQNQETTFIKHPSLQGNTTDITNPCGYSDSKEQENVPVSPTKDKPEIEEDAKFKHEEAKEMEAVTEMQLHETALESVPEDILISTTYGGVEAVVESIQEEKHLEAELAVTNISEGNMKIDFEDQNEVPEIFRPHEEVTHQASAGNEEKVELHSEGIINPTNDTEEQENGPLSLTGETLKIKDDRKFIQEEVKEMDEATKMQLLKIVSESASEDKALQTLPNTAFVREKTGEKSIQERIPTEAELVVTSTKEVKIPEIEIEEKKKVPEGFGLNEITYQTSPENEPQVEIQSEARNQETAFIKHLNLEGNTTDIINPTKDNEEQEIVPVSHTVETLEVKGDSKCITQEAQEVEGATEMQLLKTVSESVPEDKALQTLTSTASVIVEAIEETQEEIHAEAELAVKNRKEGQIQKTDFEERNKIPEALGLHEVINQARVENKVKADPLFEVQNQGTTFIKQPNLEGKTTDILNPPNNNEEQENFLASYTSEKINTNDDGKFIQEEAKDKEEAIEMKLQKTTSKSVLEDEAQSTIPILAIVNGGEGEEILPIQKPQEDENAAIDCRQENELEKKDIVKMSKRDINNSETMVVVGLENEEYVDYQSKTTTRQTVISKQNNAEEKTKSESCTRTSYDMDEQEKIPMLHSIKNSESKDGSKIVPEEAINTEELREVELKESEKESSIEDIAQPTLSNTASIDVGVEAVETAIQQEMHMEEQSANTDFKKGHILQNDFEERKKVHEDLLNQAFDLYQVRRQTNAENKLNAEPQSEAQKQETVFIKQLNSEGKTTDIKNPTNNTDEQKKVLVVQDRVKLENTDDGKLIQGEAKVIEVTEIQLLKTATESVLENETESTMPTLAIVKGENEESAATDNNSSRRKNDLGETADVVKEIDHPKTMAKVTAEDEEREEHQSEASGTQSMITKDINAEVKEASESYTNSSQGKVKMIPESHSVENSEIDDGSKIRSDEETDRKESTDEETQSNEKESVPEDNVQPTFLNRAIVSVEAADGSIQQETHMEGKLAITNTKEGKIPENDFEEQKKVPEAFDLHEVTQQTSTINKQKDEPQSEVQNHETTIVMHPTSEEKIADISPTNETEEEEEKIPAKPTKPKLEIEDDGRFILEEAKVMEEATGIQLLETASECIPEDENHSTLPTSAIVKGENIEEFIKEQTLKEEEPAAIDEKIEEFINNNCFRPENELEQTTKVVEATYEPKTMAKVRSENEQHAEHQSEQSIMANVITKHITFEGMVTAESSTISSYDGEEEELENFPESDSVDKSETKDGGKNMPDKAIDKKEATGVPKDKTMSPLSTIPSARVEKAEESIQEETKIDAESAVIDCKQEQTSKIDFEEKTKVLETFDLPKVKSKICAENEKSFESQIMDTTIIKRSNIEGLEITEISPSIDVEELEKIATEKVGIKDGEEIKQEEATEMQLLKTATESAQDDEAPSTLPISAIVQSEVSGQSFQEQTLREEESTVIDNKRSRPEYELQPTNQILEAIAQPETADHVSVENDGNAADKSEATSIEKVITQKNNSEGMMTTESGRKISYDVEEQKKIAETHFADNSKISDASKTIEEANNVKEATGVELPKSETESVPEDLSTIAYIKDETFEYGIQEEIYKEAESLVTDTKEGQRPENEFEGNIKVPEAFDLHKDAGYACTENEKKAEMQYEAQIQENVVIKHPKLEGLETQDTSPMNDTNELEKEYKVAKSGDVSELLSADIMQACSNEDVAMQKDQTMLSNKNNTDISKLSSYNHSKLDSEKEQKLVSVDCECTATSIPKNGDIIKEQENSKTSFEDSLSDVAIERVGIELETEDSSHEQQTNYDTPAEKIIKAADKDMNLKLSPESLAKEQSDKKNNFDATMYKEDGTFTDDEKVKNSLESTADKITVEFDPDGQGYMHESTKTDKIELPVEKIPEPPYTCKKLESHFDSEAHYQTDEQLSQTKDESNNIPDQISESDGQIQQQKFKDENQIKPEPQIEGQHHFSTPLIAKPNSTASLRTEVNDKDGRAGESETVEEQVTDSQLSKATESNEQSFENDPTRKKATSQNSNKAINQAATGNLEIQESEITQLGGEREEQEEEEEEEGRDELEKINTSSSGSTVIVKYIEVKSSHKKSHGILSGVGSKVKLSISKVKKAITGKSSQPKTQSPK